MSVHIYVCPFATFVTGATAEQQAYLDQQLAHLLFRGHHLAMRDSVYQAGQLATAGLATGLRVMLHPLDQKEVAKIEVARGHQEALAAIYGRRMNQRYELTHHLMTAWGDSMCRWATGAFVASQPGIEPLQVLDLFCGPALTSRAIARMGKVFRRPLDVTALDYNPMMLGRAEHVPENVQLVVGDATNLLGPPAPYQCFRVNQFDMVTAMFGIGALTITQAKEMFQQVLAVLKPDGQIFMADLHAPLPETPGEFSWLGGTAMPGWQQLAYQKALQINRHFWGWVDPTGHHYLPGLIIWQDELGKWWGYQRQFLLPLSYPWWFGLHAMTFALTSYRKCEITEQEAHLRQQALAQVEFHEARIDVSFR
jgi:ubiquinone/menaquinone biosynthesis C-methylase UbiE